jgi:hypothetical protein
VEVDFIGLGGGKLCGTGIIIWGGASYVEPDYTGLGVKLCGTELYKFGWGQILQNLTVYVWEPNYVELDPIGFGGQILLN